MSMNEKRKFGFFKHIIITYKASLAFLYMKLFKKKHGLKFDFKERIMLAVTEVNGCVMCSYVHTKLATKAGLTDKDIKSLLEGELEGVPDDQSLGVLFAKDYAFNKEKVDKEFYDRLVEHYGHRKSRAILGASEFITMTNSMGISMALLKNTLSFKHVKGSNILNEIFIPLSTMVFFPTFLILNLLIIPFHAIRVFNRN